MVYVTDVGQSQHFDMVFKVRKSSPVEMLKSMCYDMYLARFCIRVTLLTCTIYMGTILGICKVEGHVHPILIDCLIVALNMNRAY